MKTTATHNSKANRLLARFSALFAFVVAIAFGMAAQNSLPAPGTGGSYNPAPIGGSGGGWGGGFGPSWGSPGPPPPSSWGGAWGPGWGYPPTIVVNNPGWTNSGTTNVMACGYDVQGIWRTLPLYVRYYFNGVDYNVTVENAWNPWTRSWMRDIDQPAYSTDYYIRGNTYDFYVPLSIGTFYFNL